jgi:hypothetical protein
LTLLSPPLVAGDINGISFAAFPPKSCS